jgi:Fur family transcriptional regulator, ferric uptake regulator
MTATHRHVLPAAAHTGDHMLDALDQAGERITAPRRAVAQLVAEHDGHFTAADLVEDAQAAYPGVGRATIFRALDLFTGLGLVERIDLPDGGHAYVACDTAHHHHAICTSCGRSLDVDDLGLADVLAGIGERSGFTVTAHRLEIFGVCAPCRAVTVAPENA